MATPPVDRSQSGKIGTIEVHRTSSEKMGRKFERQGAKSNLLESTPLPARVSSGKIQDIGDLLGTDFGAHDCTGVKK